MTGESGPRQLVPKYNGVALYDAPAEPRQVLRNLRQGDALIVLDDGGEAWLRVRLADGAEGFVRRDTVTEIAIAPAAAPMVEQAAPAAAPVAEQAAPVAQPAGGQQTMRYEAAKPVRELSIGEYLRRTFDWSLRTFVTPLFIRWMFIGGVALIALFVVACVLLALAAKPALGVLALIISPLFFIGMVISFRMYMELAIVLFRIEENTRT